MMNEKVTQIYLPSTAKPLEIEEYLYRNCKCWIFKRKVNKWRPTPQGLDKWRNAYTTTNKYEYNDIPKKEREYYINEFWTGISEYFIQFDVCFEETIEKTIGESNDKEEAKYRLNNFIDVHYAEMMSVENIM